MGSQTVSVEGPETIAIPSYTDEESGSDSFTIEIYNTGTTTTPSFVSIDGANIVVSGHTNADAGNYWLDLIVSDNDSTTGGANPLSDTQTF